jgi:hypothetical protein
MGEIRENLMGKKILLICLLLLTSCAKNTGILRIDNGTYMVAKQAPQVSFGPPIQQRADIYKQANEFCAQKDLTVETVKLEEVNQVFGRHGSATLTFKCVPAQNK